MIRRPAISDHGEGKKSCGNVHVYQKQTPYSTIGRGKKRLLHNVHVYQKHSFCLLPSCKKVFQPRKKGKSQRFCCPDHRRAFFKLARKVGAALLEESRCDQNLRLVLDRLLGTFNGKLVSEVPGIQSSNEEHMRREVPPS